MVTITAYKCPNCKAFCTQHLGITRWTVEEVTPGREFTGIRVTEPNGNGTLYKTRSITVEAPPLGSVGDQARITVGDGGETEREHQNRCPKIAAAAEAALEKSRASKDESKK